MKHTFQQNNITYSHFDNSFTDTVINKLGQGCYWRVDQCELATDIMFKERSS